MSERRYASTAEVAAAFDVSITTVKRWVDDGLLPAQKTAGGHRRLLVSDVLRIAHSGGFPHLDVKRLGSPRRGRRSPADPKELAAQLLPAFLAGETSKARVLLDAYRGGMRADVLADAVVAPIFLEIGRQWESGRIDVLHEHRASQTCAAALYSLKVELEQPRREDRPLALGGGPEGDPYILANLLAEIVLRDAGWDVINLGPNTPMASFQKALAEFRPRLLWLSANHLEDADSFRRQYGELYQSAASFGTAVVLGGQALSAERRAGLPYTSFGDRMSNLVDFARQLQPTRRKLRSAK